MRKAEMAAELATRTGLTIKDSNEVIKTVTEIIVDAVSTGKEVQITGFGKFEARKYKPRLFKTGRKDVIYPGGYKLVFKASKGVSADVNDKISGQNHLHKSD